MHADHELPEPQLDVRIAVTGVECDRLLEMRPGPVPRLRRELAEMGAAAEQALVGADIRRVMPRRRGGGAKRADQRRRNRRGNLVLHGKHVGHRPIESLRIQMRAVGRGDQLRGDAHPAPPAGRCPRARG